MPKPMPSGLALADALADSARAVAKARAEFIARLNNDPYFHEAVLRLFRAKELATVLKDRGGPLPKQVGLLADGYQGVVPAPKRRGRPQSIGKQSRKILEKFFSKPRKRGELKVYCERVARGMFSDYYPGAADWRVRAEAKRLYKVGLSLRPRRKEA